MSLEEFPFEFQRTELRDEMCNLSEQTEQEGQQMPEQQAQHQAVNDPYS